MLLRLLVPAVCALTLVAGCGGTDPAGTAAPEVTVAPTVAAPTTAVPEPTPDTIALQKKATGAVIARGGLAVIEGPRSPDPERESTDVYWTTEICGARSRGDDDAGHVSHRRVWAGDGLYVNNIAHAYAGLTGADVVAEIEALAKTCKTFDSEIGRITILDTIDLPRYPKTDARYGYCYRVEEDGDEPYVSCDAYIARENVVSRIRVIRGSTKATNSAGLIVVGAIAAEALA